VEGYRRIRNTLRFLLANTSDFDPATNALPIGDLLEIDRYALAAARALADAAEGDYARYEFHVMVQRLQIFCSEDLGGFYLDVLKDRLYTTGKGSIARRSAQTALALIRDALLMLTAPVLSFTAEEACRIVQPGDASIFCRTWTDALPQLPDALPLTAKWSRILAVRTAVQKELETLRQGGKIGSSLQAEVAIGAPDADYDALASLHDDLKFVLITSAAKLTRADRLTIAVTPSVHTKCERCWHYRPEVGTDPKHPTLCGRCLANLYGSGEGRAFA
jgi:isoleucyl-tRNA synthetase